MRVCVLLLVMSFLPYGCDGDRGVAKNPYADTRLEPTVLSSGAQSYGVYQAGCLDGGVALTPRSSNQWVILNPSRRRYFGAPAMRDFLEYLSAKNGKLGLGDVAQAAGGPLIGGHVSHQTGLDVDLQYEILKSGQAVDSEKHPDIFVGYHRMVGYPENPRVESGLYKGKWTKQLTKLLQTAAEYPQTERIFVTPSVKVELCKPFKISGRYPQWISKLRPWWGHDDHFHVRLGCPEGSAACEKQEAVEIKDASLDPTRVGCAGPDLESWFDQDPNKPRAKPEDSPTFLVDAIETKRKDEELAKLSIEERAKRAEVPRWQRNLAKLPAKCNEVLERAKQNLGETKVLNP